MLLAPAAALAAGDAALIQREARAWIASAQRGEHGVLRHLAHPGWQPAAVRRRRRAARARGQFLTSRVPMRRTPAADYFERLRSRCVPSALGGSRPDVKLVELAWRFECGLLAGRGDRDIKRGRSLCAFAERASGWSCNPTCFGCAEHDVVG